MKTIALIGAALLCFIGTFAASITHTATIFVAPTDWSATNSVPQFDTALGTLTNVSVSVAINGRTSIRYENLDENYEGYQVTAGGTITGVATVASFTVTTKLTNSHTQAVGGWDGIPDYSGPGAFLITKTGTSANSANSAEVTPFIGIGNIPLIASATGAGFYDGPGDYAFGVSTRASALVTVTYEFSPPVCPSCDPEPECTPEPECDDRRKPRNRRR